MYRYGYTYMSIVESLCCTVEINNIINQLDFNKRHLKKKKRDYSGWA